MVTPSTAHSAILGQVVHLGAEHVLNPPATALFGGITADRPVLLILAAGKGTRFGQSPKCIQPVHGIPLARHSIDAFRRFSPSAVICMVGYRHDEVSAALGADNIYVRSANPAGGTAQAAFEAFCVSRLLDANPLLVITMGDRIVTPSIYSRLHETHRAGAREADLTFLTATYEPPRNQGKGRVVRSGNGKVTRIVEQRDIDMLEDGILRGRLHDLTEGNCPLYVIRAATLYHCLKDISNANAQGQFYLTDIVERIAGSGGDIRTTTIRAADPEYDLLCSDVTRPMDLALLEGVLASSRGLLFPGETAIENAARAIAESRPAGQVASIARQLEELLTQFGQEKLPFRPEQPVAIGISGGRCRIAFMHPDMSRFFGPAWQMPIGAENASGDDQVVTLVQQADNDLIEYYPTRREFRETINAISSDTDAMYPGEDVSDWNTYEEFGTRMSENLLLSLGYFSDEELKLRRERKLPLPPAALWVTSNMRRPFSLIGNAIASMRTLRKGHLGAKVQQYLSRNTFHGLRMASTGHIPQGGFSSSSAVTVATKNAINALFDLEIPPDLLVHLACQAEYGTGVRAGSLDQATAQKGRAGEGALISSNPRDNYRIIGTFPVPAERFHVIFPYSVERDRVAWRWSWGFYAENPLPGRLTAGEMRKMTGRSAEIAALLIRLPLDTDFFLQIEQDLLEDGALSLENRKWIASVLARLPLRATQDELRQKVEANREWLIAQFIENGGMEPAAAAGKADATLRSLFAGWRDPTLRHPGADGRIVEEEGTPLRAMVAYLFAEVARNFHLIHHPDDWIECVTLSQRGDRCVDIDPANLPSQSEMEASLAWEAGFSGPELLDIWLRKTGATVFDVNAGLDDRDLAGPTPPDFINLPGGNFFRGLALIDLVEAMLKRAFGRDAVALRVNAAGQGDYFQVHIDTQKAAIEDVKQFIYKAFYRRFGIVRQPEFVEVHPGGGAVGTRLDRLDSLPDLIRRLRQEAPVS